ncbi:hypothetical protein [Nocardia sp. NPDC004860]|uniref:hypothetical protein n=1 Tax=Nocardia sp. NPDC004860 TaxID=3154557 RepID=UPI0033A1CC75
MIDVPKLSPNMSEVERNAREHLGQLVKARIQDLGLKGKDVAVIFDAPRTSISDIMNDRSYYFGVPQLLTWAGILGIDSPSPQPTEK